MTEEEALIYDLTHKFFIRANTDDEAHIGSTTFTITMWFANWPIEDDALNSVFTDTFVVTVLAATCDCGLITWNPATTINMFTTIQVDPVVGELIEVGPNFDSMSATAGARACGSNAYNCDYTYTIDVWLGPEETKTALPYWMIYTRPNLSISP